MRYCYGICMDKLKKTTKKLVQSLSQPRYKLNTYRIQFKEALSSVQLKRKTKLTWHEIVLKLDRMIIGLWQGYACSVVCAQVTRNRVQWHYMFLVLTLKSKFYIRMLLLCIKENICGNSSAVPLDLYMQYNANRTFSLFVM